MKTMKRIIAVFMVIVIFTFTTIHCEKKAEASVLTAAVTIATIFFIFLIFLPVSLILR